MAELRSFKDLLGWTRERLASPAMRRGFEQGAIVVRQNDEARGVYFLLSWAAQDLVYFEGVGDFLMGVQRDAGSLVAGWSAFKPPYRYTSSTRCKEDSVLIRLPRDTFEELFEEDPYLGYRILKKVTAAVDDRLEERSPRLRREKRPITLEDHVSRLGWACAMVAMVWPPRGHVGRAPVPGR